MGDDKGYNRNMVFVKGVGESERHEARSGI